VRPSIEFRILLAGYHIDRNELWVAARHLAEAKQRASALNDGATIDAIAIIEAHLLLRRGRIHDGLEAISSILSTSDNYTFLSRTTTRVWEYLAILGDHRAHRYLRFDSNEIERIATSAEQEISAARLSNRAPWAGRLFSVPFSGHIGELDGDALTALGATEFGGAPEQAAAFGVDLSKKLLTAGYVRDASWAARNVIDNPHSLPQHRGRAHALWASTRAELGFLDSAEQHINKAKRIFGDLGERSSAFAAATGLWHSIQSGNVAGAREWARELGLSVTDDDSSNRFCTETARRIDSWGESMAPAAAALRATFQSRFASSLECRSDGTPLGQFRAFRGMWQTRLEGEQEQRLRDGERLLTESNARAALAVVEQLPTAEPLLWDFEDERIVSLRIRALGSESAASEVDKAMNPERERLFGALAFAALSRLEGAVYELAVKQGDRELAAEVITKRAFIADLSAEPCAAIGLRLLEATFLESVTSSRSSSHRASSARAASQYFGFVQRTGK
jgi:hypothetical protein